MQLSAQLVKKLKNQTGFKKVKGDDILLLEIKYGSAAYNTWKNKCPPSLKLRLVPYYGKGEGLVPENEYGPVFDNVERVFLGPGSVVVHYSLEKLLHSRPSSASCLEKIFLP